MEKNNNRKFWNDYTGIFENIIFLLSVTSLSADKIKNN